MSSLFGTATRASLAATRPHISPTALADTVTRYAHPDHAVTADLTDETVTLLDPHNGTPLSPRWALTALATDMSRARVQPDQIDIAFATWVEHRHPTVDEAAHAGHLVLDWADTARTRLAWVPVIERRHGIVVPMAHLLHGTDQRRELADRARANSRALTPHLAQAGAITLISARHPALSTGLLTNPDQISGFAHPVTGPAPHLVITPGAPLAQGSHAAIQRLASDINADHIVLAWADIPKP